MTCNGCLKHVDKALRTIPGVTDVDVTLPGTAKIEGDAPVETLIAAIEGAGYSASPK
jgi:Cu+-exporting ATPase